jgi:hypothetical protein
MWRAEEAWRAELQRTTVADLLADLLATVPTEVLRAGAEWVQQVQITRSTTNRRKRS